MRSRQGFVVSLALLVGLVVTLAETRVCPRGHHLPEHHKKDMIKSHLPCSVCKFVLARCLDGDGTETALCESMSNKFPGVLNQLKVWDKETETFHSELHRRCHNAGFCSGLYPKKHLFADETTEALGQLLPAGSFIQAQERVEMSETSCMPPHVKHCCKKKKPEICCHTVHHPPHHPWHPVHPELPNHPNGTLPNGTHPMVNGTATCSNDTRTSSFNHGVPECCHPHHPVCRTQPHKTETTKTEEPVKHKKTVDADPFVRGALGDKDMRPFFDYLSPWKTVHMVNREVRDMPDGVTKCVYLAFNIECPSEVPIYECSGHGACLSGSCDCEQGWYGPACQDQVLQAPPTPQKPCPGKPECTNHGTCYESKCSCEAGYFGTDCADIMPDGYCPTYDGKVCSGHGKCVDGDCLCEPEYLKPDCARRKQDSQMAQCDPPNCSGHGVCKVGACVCKPDWSGPRCDVKRCPNDCLLRGECMDGVCICRKPFFGEDCGEIGCVTMAGMGNVTCSGHGQCRDGLCDCVDGWHGEDCGEAACHKNENMKEPCNGHGKCTKNACKCLGGWVGVWCEFNECPANCSGHGDCIGKMCQCHDGWAGKACKEKTCPGDPICSGHGMCIDNHCECDLPWYGDVCNSTQCPNDCSGHGTCEAGVCNCTGVFAGLDCSEREHACPNNCSHHGTCNDGICDCDPQWKGFDCSVPTCPEDCNGRGDCVNLKCVCRKGYYGPSCNMTECPSNCTGPDHGTCKPDGVCECTKQFMGVDCSRPRCPDDCMGNGECINGTCHCFDRYFEANCSRRNCLDPQCSGHGTCDLTEGICKCNPGWINGTCDVQIPDDGKPGNKTCPDNCSGHGTCLTGTGICDCDSPYWGGNCGKKGCPNDCSNAGQCLDDGTCKCNNGYSGDDCSILSCPDNCGGPSRGSCDSKAGKCNCLEGYYGEACEMSKCPKDCCGYGTCDGLTGTCKCLAGASGPDCCSMSCPHDCNHRGVCSQGVCDCFDGYSGVSCGDVACPNNCTSPEQGTCDGTQCRCKAGYTGLACEQVDCPMSCSGHGDCLLDGCACFPGWSGRGCEIEICPKNCSAPNGECTAKGCNCAMPWSGDACDFNLNDPNSPHDIPLGIAEAIFYLKNTTSAATILDEKAEKRMFLSTLSQITDGAMDSISIRDMRPNGTDHAATSNAMKDAKAASDDAADKDGLIDDTKIIAWMPESDGDYLYGLVESYTTNLDRDPKNHKYILLDLDLIGIECLEVKTANNSRPKLCFDVTVGNEATANSTTDSSNSTLGNSTDISGNSTDCANNTCMIVQVEPPIVTDANNQTHVVKEGTRTTMFYHLVGNQTHMEIQYIPGKNDTTNTTTGGQTGGGGQDDSGGDGGGDDGLGGTGGGDGSDAGSRASPLFPNPMYRCRNNCSGHGKCTSAAVGNPYCDCVVGWVGEDCSFYKPSEFKKIQTKSAALFASEPTPGEAKKAKAEASKVELGEVAPMWATAEDETPEGEVDEEIEKLNKEMKDDSMMDGDDNGDTGDDDDDDGGDYYQSITGTSGLVGNNGDSKVKKHTLWPATVDGKYHRAEVDSSDAPRPSMRGML